MRISLDFETRSACNLKQAASYRYAIDPSTSVLCAAWAFDDEPVHLWHPALGELPEEGAEDLDELADAVSEGAEVWAWNAGFERHVWRHVLRRMAPWMPEVLDSQWRCSAALAATRALPRKLDEAAAALGLSVRKDAAGHRVMMKLSQPRKPTKADPTTLWHEGTEDLRTLFRYCPQDVEVEREIRQHVGDWTPEELRVWQLDQVVNERGMYLDREMADAAANIHAIHARKHADREVRRLSRGSITKTTKRDQLLAWVWDQGVELSDTQKGTLEALLEVPDQMPDEVPIAQLPPHVRRVLAIWRNVNRTSTQKFKAMLRRVCPDGRARDLLRYHGASTGRWAGQGIQPQNFPRGSIKFLGDWEDATPEEQDAALEAAALDIRDRDPEDLDLLWGSTMELLASALRAAMRAAPGHELLAADYAAIEARVTFWLAGDEEALEILRSGKDIYKVQAADIYEITVDQVTKPQRQLGKQSVLGLGFQMGAPKFQGTCAGYGIDIDAAFARRVVRIYREGHPEVVDLWKELEALAIQATRAGDGAPWLQDKRGRTAWAVRGRFLHCRLPSGRLLSYYKPWVVRKPFIWTDPETGEKKDLGIRDKLRFWGVDSRTHRWTPQATYGGKLTENVVQAIARDLMAAAMLRVEEHGYPVVLTVHDEIVAEVPAGFGDLAEFEALVAVTPEWAAGLPVKAAGWRGVRYRK